MNLKKTAFDPDALALDDEEQEITVAIEQGKIKKAKKIKEKMATAKIAAANYLSKDTKINIRLSSSDLLRIKQMAAYEGLPYQTLIASLLHKYACGHLPPN